jgi:hypothetical protein
MAIAYKNPNGNVILKMLLELPWLFHVRAGYRQSRALMHAGHAPSSQSRFAIAMR